MAADAVTACVHIDAPPERVYEYFTRPEAIVSWMGEYALLEAEPGGRFVLDIKGAPVRGRFLELDPPRRLLSDVWSVLFHRAGADHPVGAFEPVALANPLALGRKKAPPKMSVGAAPERTICARPRVWPARLTDVPIRRMMVHLDGEGLLLASWAERDEAAEHPNSAHAALGCRTGRLAGAVVLGQVRRWGDSGC